MSDASIEWRKTFSDLFLRSVDRYRGGHQRAKELVDEKGVRFLQTIGHTEQEFFDFVEDFAKGGEPTLETALGIAAVRREYFLTEQNGIRSTSVISVDQLPAKDAEIDGIGWLPRLIPKAQAKLRGEMPPELMYCCGGDRRFFRTQGLDPVEFLRHAWEARGNTGSIVAWVKQNRRLTVL